MATDNALSPLITDPELESQLRVHRGWAAKDRLRSHPRIPYITIGRSVRYRPQDVLSFIASNTKATAA